MQPKLAVDAVDTMPLPLLAPRSSSCTKDRDIKPLPQTHILQYLLRQWISKWASVGPARIYGFSIEQERRSIVCMFVALVVMLESHLRSGIEGFGEAILFSEHRS
jgi:hypothetical protein